MIDPVFQPQVLRLSQGTATACCYGAQVSSWRTAEGVERLFLSPVAEYRPGAAIRGGMPVIFPQFAGCGPLPKHGFARTTTWSLLANDAHGLRFRVTDSAASRALWPYAFTAELAVQLFVDTLRVQLSVVNTDVHQFSFSVALHTYLRVNDIAQATVHGLQGLRYRDSAVADVLDKQQDLALRLAGEVDRIYCGCPAPVVVREPGQHDLECSSAGFTDVVIWNPGAEKCAALKDMLPDDYRHMLCVEAAVIEHPVILQPGERWSGAQQLRVMR